jgi:hypothetical protein
MLSSRATYRHLAVSCDIHLTPINSSEQEKSCDQSYLVYCNGSIITSADELLTTNMLMHQALSVSPGGATLRRGVCEETFIEYPEKLY